MYINVKFNLLRQHLKEITLYVTVKQIKTQNKRMSLIQIIFNVFILQYMSSFSSNLYNICACLFLQEQEWFNKLLTNSKPYDSFCIKL